MARNISPARIGFLLSCFLISGLAGVFASFSIPAPVVDELHQEAALEAVLEAPTPAAQAQAITALSTKALVDADTAALVSQGAAPLPQRVAAAQKHMRAEVVAEARASAYNVRLMVITLTVLSAAFGVAFLGPELK